jgi:ABC-2 type transport system ATP-binding protein
MSSGAPAHRALEIRNLGKRYSASGPWAVHDVSITVRPGEIVGLVGPNGAGKTTTLSIVAGLLGPTRGTVAYNGAPCTPRQPRPWLSAWVGEPGFYGHLKGVDHLRVTVALRGVRLSTVESFERLSRAGLSFPEANRRVRTYSTGMKQRLAFASATAIPAEYLALDEPTAGLDPEGIRFVLDETVRLAEEGTGILLSSHRLNELETVADRIVLILDGSATEMDTRSGRRQVVRLRAGDDVHLEAWLEARGLPHVRVGRSVVVDVTGGDLPLSSLPGHSRSPAEREPSEATLEELFLLELAARRLGRPHGR